MKKLEKVIAVIQDGNRIAVEIGTVSEIKQIIEFENFDNKNVSYHPIDQYDEIIKIIEKHGGKQTSIIRKDE